MRKLRLILGYPTSNCEVALEKLIDLRLVRHLDGLYEIAHDFLAREVAAKLVDYRGERVQAGPRVAHLEGRELRNHLFAAER